MFYFRNGKPLPNHFILYFFNFGTIIMVVWSIHNAAFCCNQII